MTVLLFTFRLWQTTGCRHFLGFYFNPLSIKINVEEQRGLDNGSNQQFSKFFHNKVSAAVYEISKSYSQTIDPRFLLEILGPVGLVLALISASKVIKKPKSIYTLSLLSVLTASLLFILPIDPKKTFYIVAFTWFGFSLISATSLSKSKLSILLFVVLLLASFWYFALSWQMPRVCNEIFFN